MDPTIDEIRQKIQKRVLDFVKENQGRKTGLLIKTPCGTGKTRVTSKTLFSRDDIFTVFLCTRHPDEDSDDNILTWNPKIFHLKGRKKEGMCKKPELIKQAEDYKINLHEFICKKCEYLKDKTCPYYQQQKELRENLRSWIGVQHHLNTDIVQRCFERSNYPYNILVIDEYCIDNIISDKKFDADDLNKIAEVIGTEIRNQWNNEEVDAFIWILFSLQGVIRDTNKSIKCGIEFIQSFIKHLERYTRTQDQTWEDIEEILFSNDNSKSMEIFGNIYRDVLYKRFQSGDKKKYFKDIYFEVLNIAKKCFRYYRNPPYDDFNLPFYCKMKRRDDSKKFDKKIIHSSFSRSNIPDVPIILLDATGEKQVYKDAFGCEFEEYGMDIPITRNIIQITDGFYWSVYFRNKKAREGLFFEIATIVKHHLSRGEKHINIITLKKIEFQLCAYLINVAEIDKKKFTTHHYGNVKGSNEFMKDNILILLGTPEPHIWDFLMQIGAIYEGEPSLSNKKYIERKDSKFYDHDYRHKDKRYRTHVRMKRENELKQCVDRVRWFLLKELEIKKKQVYLYSMASIGYPTQEVTRKDLMASTDPKADINRKIQEAKHNSFYMYLSHLQDGDTKTSMYRKLEKVVPFKTDKQLFKRTYKILTRDKDIVTENGKLYKTEKGKQVLFQLQREINELELSPEKWQ